MQVVDGRATNGNLPIPEYSRSNVQIEVSYAYKIPNFLQEYFANIQYNFSISGSTLLYVSGIRHVILHTQLSKISCNILYRSEPLYFLQYAGNSEHDSYPIIHSLPHLSTLYLNH